MQQAQYDYELTIIGGGLSGLGLAMQVRKDQPDARILVLEKQPHPLPEAAVKVGESTVEIGAWYFHHVLDLKEHIEKEHLPKYGLRFFFPGADPDHLQSGLELGITAPLAIQSYQLDRQRPGNRRRRSLHQVRGRWRNQSDHQSLAGRCNRSKRPVEASTESERNRRPSHQCGLVPRGSHRQGRRLGRLGSHRRLQ